MFTLQLPSSLEIVFKATSFRERRQLAKNYNRNEGYLLEELMAANALVKIGGTPVLEEWASDPISRFDNWSIPDVQYYLEAFMTMNSIEEVIRERAQEAAKKLMGAGGTQTEAQSGGRPRALKVNSGSTIDG
jgi:hypothetical protein